MDTYDFYEKLPAFVEVAMAESGITGVSLEETTVTKTNDTVLHGLMFKKKGSNICPTYYMEDFYEAFGEQGRVEEAAREMVRAYCLVKDTQVPEESINMEPDLMEDVLGFRILDMERNKDYLSSIPYKEMCGSLVMIADIGFGWNGDWRTVVTKELLSDSALTEEMLFDRAMVNSVKNAPPILTELGDDLEGKSRNLLQLDRDEFPADRVYVLSNSSRRFGVGVFFYPGIPEEIASRIGGYTVIPSSVHETILIPDSLGIPAQVMLAMLSDANENVVDRQEVLSEKTLHVDKSGEISQVVS